MAARRGEGVAEMPVRAGLAVLVSRLAEVVTRMLVGVDGVAELQTRAVHGPDRGPAETGAVRIVRLSEELPG